MTAERYASLPDSGRPTESVIGGLFGRVLAPPVETTGTRSPTFPSDLFGDLAHGADIVYTATGRGGILLVCRSVAPRTVWFPSYLCPSMVRGVQREFEVRFYGVDADLRADTSFTADVGPDDLVCVLDYFGRPAEQDLLRAVRASGAVLLEDATHSWMSFGVGTEADFTVVSLVKSLDVPSGGVVVGRQKGVLPPSDALPPAPDEWWAAAHEAWDRRGAYDAGSATPEARAVWYELYSRAAALAPEEPASMNPLTRNLLRRGFDRDAVARRRIENHEVLFEAFGHLALLPEPPLGVVPFGFVCRFDTCTMRDDIRRQLIEALIFPPIHWDLDDVVPLAFEAARDLSRRILTIPCDQRYDRADMARIIHVLERATI